MQAKSTESLPQIENHMIQQYRLSLRLVYKYTCHKDAWSVIEGVKKRSISLWFLKCLFFPAVSPQTQKARRLNLAFLWQSFPSCLCRSPARPNRTGLSSSRHKCELSVQPAPPISYITHNILQAYPVFCVCVFFCFLFCFHVNE